MKSEQCGWSSFIENEMWMMMDGWLQVKVIHFQQIHFNIKMYKTFKNSMLNKDLVVINKLMKFRWIRAQLDNLLTSMFF
jgi:hypothetical protein